MVAKTRVFDGIQTLRFVAALLVVVTHSTLYAHERLNPQIDLWDRGSVGVDIFFVISGFVMIVSSSHLTAGDFTLRRLVRIVPLYWAVTTLKVAILLAAPALALHATVDWLYIIKSYFFIPAFNSAGRVEPIHGVGWTLIFEMFFYALFAAALALRIKIIPFLSTILIACFALSLLRQPEWPAWTVYFNSRVLGFLAGIFIGKYLTTVRIPISLSCALIAVGGACIAFMPWGPGELSTAITHVVPSCLIVIGVVGLEPAAHGKWPKALVFLGAASYSLYLIHPIVAPIAPVLLRKLSIASGLLSISLSVSIALLSSIAVYVLFEKPATRLFTRLTSKSSQTPNAPSANVRTNPLQSETGS